MGNEKLLAGRKVDWSSHATLVNSLRSEGLTPLVVASGRRYLGLIAVADVVAPHSREAVERLKEMKLDVLLLSGDHRTIVARVAREVGIQRIQAEVLPDEKQSAVAQLREGGQVEAAKRGSQDQTGSHHQPAPSRMVSGVKPIIIINDKLGKRLPRSPFCPNCQAAGKYRSVGARNCAFDG